MSETVDVRTVVPAHPGWCLAIFIEGGKDSDGTQYDASFSCEDIIAWDIKVTSGPFHASIGRPGERWTSREVTPITVDGTKVEHMRNRWAIRRPDGAYIAPGDQTLGSEAEAIAEYTARAEQERAERKTA